MPPDSMASPTVPAATRLFATMQAASVDGEVTPTREAGERAPAGGSAQAPASGDAAIGEEIRGTTLLLVAYGPEDAPQQVLSDSRVTAQLGDDLLRGSGGCNDYVAALVPSGDHFTVAEVEATEEFCGEPAGVMEQERAYLAALESVNGFRWFWEAAGDQQVITAGELQYELPDGSSGLLRYVAEQQQAAATPVPGATAVATDGVGQSPLEQVERIPFELLSFGPSANPQAVLPGTTLSLTFMDGQVRGSAGCNSFSGPVNTRGSFFTLGPLASTEGACAAPAGVMEQESAYLAALAAVDGYRWSWRDVGAQQIIDGAELHYTLSDGTTGTLSFTAAE